MPLLPWSYRCSAGFTLSGWHSPPSGRPLLHFLHGNGFCGRSYEPLLAPLSEHFDLWLCDVQGHGDSEHGGVFRGWNRSAELVLEAFEAGRKRFGEVPALALGHSFGGVLTALLLARPGQPFQRAALLDPVLFGPSMLLGMRLSGWLGLAGRHALAKKTAQRRRHWASRANALDTLRGRGVFRDWSEPALQAYVDHALRDGAQGGVELKCRPSREVEIFSSFPRRLWPSLRRIEVPLLVQYGDHSYPFVGPSARRLARLNPQVQAEQVPGGHCFMQEQPQLSAERLLPFLLGSR